MFKCSHQLTICIHSLLKSKQTHQIVKTSKCLMAPSVAFTPATSSKEITPAHIFHTVAFKAYSCTVHLPVSKISLCCRQHTEYKNQQSNLKHWGAALSDLSFIWCECYFSKPGTTAVTERGRLCLHPCIPMVCVCVCDTEGKYANSHACLSGIC